MTSLSTKLAVKCLSLRAITASAGMLLVLHLTLPAVFLEPFCFWLLLNSMDIETTDKTNRKLTVKLFLQVGYA